MPTQPGTKYVVIPPDVYQNMKDLLNVKNDNSSSRSIRNSSIQPPEKTALLKSESAMRELWDRNNISAEEKV